MKKTTELLSLERPFNGKDPNRERQVKPYDVSQTSISKKRREAMERVYGEFSPNAESVLLNYVMLPAKVILKKIAYFSYEQYQKTIDGAVLLTVFDIEPQETLGMMRVDGDLVLVAMDRILGGEGNLPKNKRELSLIELKMSEALVNQLLNKLNAVWETFGECEFRYKASSQVTKTLKFLPPEEPVIVATLDVKLGETMGQMEVCLPFSFLKPIMASLEKPEDQALADLTDPKIAKIVKTKMEDIIVPIRAFLGELELAFDDLSQIEVGDVLRLGKTDKELIVKAENIPVFFAKPGTSNDKVAVEVKGPYFVKSGIVDGV